MRHVALITTLVALSVPAYSAKGADATLVLVEANMPKCIIIVSADASPTELLAGRELQTYIERASGARVPLVTTKSAYAENQVKVFVGRAERIDEFGLQIRLPRMHPEGYCIDVTSEAVLITSPTDLGLLFGVYQFLEKFVGCRWLFPGELGEVVPVCRNIILTFGRLTSNPAFELRTFKGSSNDSAIWGIRNGMNGFYTKEFAESHGDALWTPFTVHGFERILPARRYYEDHPEIFPLRNGRRVPYSLSSGQLCTTNSEALEMVVHVVSEHFTVNPSARAYWVSPNDDYGWCQCPRCVAFDRQYGYTRKRVHGRRIVTDRLMRFMSDVATRLSEQLRGRDFKLLTLAYVNYVYPPHKFKPTDSVVVLVCHYTPACYAHPIAYRDCEANEQFRKLLLAWVKCARRSVGVYAYTDKSMWLGLPRPVVRQMGADIKYLHHLGIKHYFAQSNARWWQLNLPLYYVTAKLLWNPKRNIDELLDDFYKHAFGRAATAMREYYATFENALAQSGAHFNASPKTEAPAFLTPTVMNRARIKLNEALRAARDESEAVRKRIAAVQEQFERSFNIWQIMWHYAQFIKTGDPDEFNVASRIYREQLKRYGKRSWFARYLSELNRPMSARGGIIWRGFGDAETLGGRTCWNSDETGPGDNAAGWATLRFAIKDPTKPVKLTLIVWGQSQLNQIVICSKGRGKGYAQGGIWTPIAPQKPLSGKPQWEELVYIIPPKFFERGVKWQIVGFGGGDSQIWLADARIEQLD